MLSSYMVSPQNEFFNVLATQMTQFMTLYTGRSYEGSLQCELSYVFVSLQLGKTTLNTVFNCKGPE